MLDELKRLGLIRQQIENELQDWREGRRDLPGPSLEIEAEHSRRMQELKERDGEAVQGSREKPFREFTNREENESSTIPEASKDDDEICKQFERNAIYPGSPEPKRVDAFSNIIAQTEDSIRSGSADGRKAERVLEQRLYQARRPCSELGDRLEAVERKAG
jgi:hypothetical protein